MENLEKIDLLRERLGVSYEEAYRALEESGGDVVEALIKLEREKREGAEKGEGGHFHLDKETINVKGQELIDKIKELVKEGNINKIVVKSRDRTMLEIPVTAGVVSLVLFPYLTLLAGMAAMFKDYTLEIDKKEGEEEETGTFEEEEL